MSQSRSLNRPITPVIICHIRLRSSLLLINVNVITFGRSFSCHPRKVSSSQHCIPSLLSYFFRIRIALYTENSHVTRSAYIATSLVTLTIYLRIAASGRTDARLILSCLGRVQTCGATEYARAAAARPVLIGQSGNSRTIMSSYYST